VEINYLLWMGAECEWQHANASRILPSILCSSNAKSTLTVKFGCF